MNQTGDESMQDDVKQAERLADAIASIKKEIGKVIIGQNAVINQLLISMLCKGHCLLVGVPGLAKTLLIKTFSQVTDLKFNRIQFTPDLMPSDICGTEIIEEDQVSKKRNFRFIPGPLFANVILADEINRTPPKTQSALLEAMQEHKITVAGKTYTLDEPFFVLATQNPIEQEGTYPLPEAQLDRFMFNLWLDYPAYEEEKEIVRSTTGMIASAPSVAVSGTELIGYQELIRKVPVADSVIDYAVTMVGRTRPQSETAPQYIKDYVRWGGGPRASQYLILAAKANAIINGRYTPSEDDVRFAMKPVLRHRIITNFTAEADGVNSTEIIQRLISS
jgi:MoxR-like ATPase